MTVLTFCRFRFSPADLATIDAVVQPKLRRRLWAKVERATDHEADALYVYFPSRTTPSFVLERDAGGYRLSLVRANGGLLDIGAGATVEQALTVWLPPSGRLAATAAF